MEIGKCSITANEVIAALEAEKMSVLATCAENRVTVRPMSHVNDGLTVFIQTCKHSLKMSQIRANPNVALLAGTFEIEGTAQELGHPLAEENAFFREAFRNKHPNYSEYWSYDGEIVVKISITRVSQWRYIDGKPFIASADF